MTGDLTLTNELATDTTFADLGIAPELLNVLTEAGFDVHWRDARQLLLAVSNSSRSQNQQYLSATCEFDADPALAGELAAAGRVIVTQGFIARNIRGDTVLLGQGTFTGAGNRDLDYLGKAIVVASQDGDPASAIIDWIARYR